MVLVPLNEPITVRTKDGMDNTIIGVNEAHVFKIDEDWYILVLLNMGLPKTEWDLQIKANNLKIYT